MNDLAMRIREARQRRGLTQDQLAGAVGVSRSAVAQWETGRSGQLTSNLAKVGAALGIDIAALIDGVHPSERAPSSPWISDRLSAEFGNMTGDEIALLRLYRSCPPPDQQILLTTARRLSRRPA